MEKAFTKEELEILYGALLQYMQRFVKSDTCPVYKKHRDLLKKIDTRNLKQE